MSPSCLDIESWFKNLRAPHICVSCEVGKQSLDSGLRCLVYTVDLGQRAGVCQAPDRSLGCSNCVLRGQARQSTDGLQLSQGAVWVRVVHDPGNGLADLLIGAELV